MFLIISAAVLVASGVGLAIMYNRNAEHVQSVTVANVVVDRLSEVKSSILEDRLKRKLFSGFKSLWRTVRPFFVWIKNNTLILYHRLLEKERTYKEASERQAFSVKEKHEQIDVIEEKLEDTYESETEGDMERKYLEVLSLDPKNIDAYEGLGRLYFKQKDFEHAKEIFEHILRLGTNKLDHFLDLAESWQALEKYREAKGVLINALKKEPRNPKVIDRLIEIAILLKDRITAKNYLQQLKDVNPENKKIKEFAERIKILK